MKYALNLAEDGRILSVTFEKYAPADAELVEELPSGDAYEYRYVEGEYIHDPLPTEPVEEPAKEVQMADLAAAIERGLTT